MSINKGLSIILIGFFFTSIILSNSVFASGPFDIILDPIKEKFELKSEIEISVDEKFSSHATLIQPGTYKNVTVNVRYRLDVKPIVSKLYLESKIGRLLFFKDADAQPQMKIDIKAVVQDFWNCDVLGEQKTVKVNLSDEFQEASVDFKVYVEPIAKPFNTSKLRFSACNRPGDLNIEYVEAETNAEVVYGGEVLISVSSFHFDIVEPGEESIVPVTIRNWGDMETIVDIQLEGKTETWDVEFNSSSLVLEPSGSKTIKFKVTPKSMYSKDETIRIKFSPRASVDLGFDDDSLYGEDRYFKMDLIGTNLEPGDDTTQESPGFGIISLTIGLVLVGAIGVFLKRKSKS